MRFSAKPGILFTVVCCAFAGGAARGADNPVTLMRGVSLTAPLAPQNLLYRSGDVAVMRAADARPADFDGVYVVHLRDRFDLPKYVEDLGDVLAFAPKHLAVVRFTRANAEEAAARLHADSHACGMLVRLTGRPIPTEAAANPTPIIPIGPTDDQRVTALTAQVVSGNIRETINRLATLQTRYHRSTTGIGVAASLAELYESFAAGRTDVTIKTYDHGSTTPQDSLIVRIEGTTRPSEVIVLGSHLDSINQMSPSSGRSPGADDNASGTATNLEIFRILMASNFHPERTIEIHAYAAEEAGLLGSEDIANDYADRGVNVVAMMQHDMTAWKAQGAIDKIYIVSTATHAGFNQSLTQLAQSYSGLPVGSGSLRTGTSDNESWTNAGFAAGFPFENPSNYNTSIHTASDSVANLNGIEQAGGFAKLGLAYITHFAGIN